MEPLKRVPQFQTQKIVLAETLVNQNVAMIEQNKEIIRLLKLIYTRTRR